MNWLTTKTFLSRIGKPELWGKVQNYEYVRDLKRDFDAGKEELKTLFGDEYDPFHKLMKCEGDTNQIREHGLIRYDDIFVFTRVAFPDATKDEIHNLASTITGPEGRGVVSITQFSAFLEECFAAEGTIETAAEDILEITKFREVKVEEKVPTAFLYKVLADAGLAHHYAKFEKKGLSDLTEETQEINENHLKEFGFGKIGERWAVHKVLKAAQKPWIEAKKKEEEEAKKAQEEPPAKKTEENTKEPEAGVKG